MISPYFDIDLFFEKKISNKQQIQVETRAGQQVIELQRRLQAENARNQQLNRNLSEVSTHEVELNNINQRLITEIQRLQTTNASLTSQLQIANSRSSQMERDHSTEIQQMQQVQNELRRDFTELQETVMEQGIRIAEIQTQIENVDNNITLLNQSNTHVNTQLESIMAILTQMQRQQQLPPQQNSPPQQQQLPPQQNTPQQQQRLPPQQHTPQQQRLPPQQQSPQQQYQPVANEPMARLRHHPGIPIEILALDPPDSVIHENGTDMDLSTLVNVQSAILAKKAKLYKATAPSKLTVPLNAKPETKANIWETFEKNIEGDFRARGYRAGFRVDQLGMAHEFCSLIEGDTVNAILEKLIKSIGQHNDLYLTWEQIRLTYRKAFITEDFRSMETLKFKELKQNTSTVEAYCTLFQKMLKHTGHDEVLYIDQFILGLSDGNIRRPTMNESRRLKSLGDTHHLDRVMDFAKSLSTQENMYDAHDKKTGNPGKKPTPPRKDIPTKPHPTVATS